jgi:Fic family protein
MYVATPPSTDELMLRVSSDRLVEALVAVARNPPREYLHWDKVRHLDPPSGLATEEWWLALKMTRSPLLRPLPFATTEGRSFVYAMPDEVLRHLHFVDQHCSGEIAMPAVVTADEQAKQHYLVNSLMEEAIRSSQLEGAATSRRAAKEMLQSGRPPKNRSERMIVNNYGALQFMRTVDQLTPNVVLELQRILTLGTLDDERASGRLQTPDDERVAVVDRNDDSVLHVPPPGEELPARLDALCAFANERGPGDSFMHPVIRAMVLHLWLAHDHPFADGNGRTARALFYWSMRMQGYWLVEYLSISRILRHAPSQYARSFVLTETDGGDATHFVIYQLRVMKRAVDEMHVYLRRKADEVREVARLVRRSDRLNHRQLALLSNAVRHPERRYTLKSHALSHDVTHETARLDLRLLLEHGFLSRRRIGRQFVFEPVADLTDRLQEAV